MFFPWEKISLVPRDFNFHDFARLLQIRWTPPSYCMTPGADRHSYKQYNPPDWLSLRTFAPLTNRQYCLWRHHTLSLTMRDHEGPSGRSLKLRTCFLSAASRLNTPLPSTHVPFSTTSQLRHHLPTVLCTHRFRPALVRLDFVSVLFE